MPTVLPIVNAARTVPIPNPSRRPKNISVIQAVTAKHVTSKIILTFEYETFIISDNSLGKRSVCIIGNLHLFDNAMPIPKQEITYDSITRTNLNRSVKCLSTFYVHQAIH